MLDPAGLEQSTLRSVVALSALSMLACVEKLSASMNTICVERDWVVVLSGNDQPFLTTTNAQMRRIDLFCKLVGPLAISLVDAHSRKLSIIVVGSMSGLCVGIEYVAIARVYWSLPAMQVARLVPSETLRPLRSSTQSYLARAASLVRIYSQHAAFIPSICLAMTYLTVLSFSGQLITFLLSLGLSSASMGILRAAAAVFELSATWLGPRVTDRIGTVRGGLWFLNLELAFVGIACSCLWFPMNPTSPPFALYGLIMAVLVSRLGLWGFDLSAQYLVQEAVEPDLRGTFSSIEFSLQNIFEVLSFACTIVFPRPEDFRYPALVSALAVAAASVLYTRYLWKVRGHICHTPYCLGKSSRGTPHVGAAASIQ